MERRVQRGVWRDMVGWFAFFVALFLGLEVVWEGLGVSLENEKKRLN